MSRAKQGSKRKSRACAVPLLGAAGLSVSLATGAPAATVGPVLGHEITLGEEEISDVSLATFYVFDKENPQVDLQLVRHGGGCGGHGHGCGGHGHGCGGSRRSRSRLQRSRPRLWRLLARLRRLRWDLVGWLRRLWRLFRRLLVLAEWRSDLVLLLITGSLSELLCPRSPFLTGNLTAV